MPVFDVKYEIDLGRRPLRTGANSYMLDKKK